MERGLLPPPAVFGATVLPVPMIGTGVQRLFTRHLHPRHLNAPTIPSTDRRPLLVDRPGCINSNDTGDSRVRCVDCIMMCANNASRYLPVPVRRWTDFKPIACAADMASKKFDKILTL
jgi:hypothetical protein